MDGGIGSGVTVIRGQGVTVIVLAPIMLPTNWNAVSVFPAPVPVTSLAAAERYGTIGLGEEPRQRVGHILGCPVGKCSVEVSCSVLPTLIVAVGGATVIEVRSGAGTVTVVEA
jgi:hypothetical protein